MRVSLNVSIDVDPAKWDATYGTGTSSKAVVDDVRSYFLDTMRQSAAADECGVTITAK